jgi:hypothetical protein
MQDKASHLQAAVINVQPLGDLYRYRRKRSGDGIKPIGNR